MTSSIIVSGGLQKLEKAKKQVDQKVEKVESIELKTSHKKFGKGSKPRSNLTYISLWLIPLRLSSFVFVFVLFCLHFQPTKPFV
jgi:hypothetical protein